MYVCNFIFIARFNTLQYTGLQFRFSFLILQDCIHTVELKKNNRYLNANVIFYCNVLCIYDAQLLHMLLLIIILILQALSNIHIVNV
jgi:hypothetical protein